MRLSFLLAVLTAALSGACGSDTQSGSGGSGGTAGALPDASTGGGQTGGSAGSSVGAPCTGPGNAGCASDEYCSAPGVCAMAAAPDGGVAPGEYPGICAKRPTSCSSTCDFACGVDGVAYCNDCLAQQAGAEVAPYCPVCPEYRKPCTTDADCVFGLLCCAPSCPYPTGCGDASVGPMCEKAYKGMCPVAA